MKTSPPWRAARLVIRTVQARPEAQRGYTVKYNTKKSAAASVVIDPTTVRAFLAIMHERAAHVTAGMSEPGFMTLVRVDPNTDGALPQRFVIGDVETMAGVRAR